jgi:hypothetical protein
MVLHPEDDKEYGPPLKNSSLMYLHVAHYLNPLWSLAERLVEVFWDLRGFGFVTVTTRRSLLRATMRFECDTFSLRWYNNHKEIYKICINLWLHVYKFYSRKCLFCFQILSEYSVTNETTVWTFCLITLSYCTVQPLIVFSLTGFVYGVLYRQQTICNSNQI